MFYKNVGENEAIKQGDIFYDLPFIEFDLERISTINQAGQIVNGQKWEQVKGILNNHIVGFKVISVSGIVVSQDCDNLRNDFISFARVRPLSEVTNQNPQTDLNWAKLIKNGPAEASYQWFYLPKNTRFSMSERKAADFDVLFQLPKSSLLTRLREMRKASLEEDSLKHFRDSLVKYLTRYAHNEWYSFTRDEFQAYKDEIVRRNPDEAANITPYSHQR